MKSYREQLKQMLQDLAKEKEKDAEKPLPLMNQVLRDHDFKVTSKLRLIKYSLNDAALSSLLHELKNNLK